VPLSSKEYKGEVLLPVLQNIATQKDQPGFYDGLTPDSEIIVLPKGTSETESRKKQVG